MDAAEAHIKLWAEKNAAFVEFLGLDRVNLCFTLSVGIDEKSLFQIYVNQEATPMFVMSDDAPLREWTERINTFVQRRESTITLELLQGEMETSLKLLFKIAAEPAQPPSFSFSPPPPSTSGPDESAPWSVDESGGYSFGLGDSGAAPVSPPLAGVPARTEETVRRDIELWRDAHENAKLVIVGFKPHEDGVHQVISLTIGEPPIAFDLNCNSDWTLAAVSSDHPTLKNLVEQFSEYIAQVKPSLEGFFDDFANLLQEFKDAWESGSIEEIVEALKEIVANERGEEIEWKRVIPTKEDFDREIMPALHNYMTDDGLEIWQIDEWLRRIRMEFDKSSGERNDAMQFIIHNVFHGANPPRAIRKFFPKPLPLHRRVTINDNWKYSPMATEAAKENLRQQMAEMEQLQSEDHGFVAMPIRNNLFHWEIKLHGFEPDSAIFQELISYTVNVSDDNLPKDSNGRVKPLPIIMELKLPPNYPHGAPAFRIIRPRIFNDLEAERTFEDALNEDDFATPEERALALNDSTDTLKPEEGHPLSFSMALERRKWSVCPKIVDLVRQIRGTLSRAKHLHIDLNSSKKGIPTDGNFWNEYVCMAASSITNSYTDADLGGKILLPASALNELMGRSLYGGGSFSGGYGYGGLNESGTFQNDSPMIFEIATTSGRRSFVGVMEFRAPEGHVGLPQWMMASLGVAPGQLVQVRKVRLPKGLFFQLQPHSADFQRVSNVKAMMEWVLRRFVAMSEGDKVQVEHDGKKYRFNVLKCTPERAIAITDADVSVDFAAPLEGVLSEDDLNVLTRSQEIKKHEEELEKHKEHVTLGSMFPQGKEGVDFKTCPNCFQPIPIGNSLHELSCERRNWYCHDCKKVVLKTDKDAHMKEFHEPVPCDWCGTSLEKRLHFTHKKNECPERSVMCQFCEMKLLARQLYEHERTCGSVTEVCEKCRARYPRRELPYHESACTGTRPPANRNQRRATEDFMACEKCGRGFTQFDELQVHILTDHADDYSTFALFGGPGFQNSDDANATETQKEEKIEEQKDEKKDELNEKTDQEREKAEQEEGKQADSEEPKGEETA